MTPKSQAWTKIDTMPGPKALSMDCIMMPRYIVSSIAALNRENPSPASGNIQSGMAGMYLK
jgi:hypothetical protein